jgi:glycosyltransferase involved in cell wall biosynthesis
VLYGVRVVVVVPSFEVAAHIVGVLRGMPAEVDHVLVVDDGSHDRTADLARGVGDARVEVVSHASNRGVGAAIATGYRRAMELAESPRDALVVMAGDGQMDPADLPRVVEPIARGRADYVKGCRFDWPGVREQMPLARLLGGWVFSVLTSQAIGQPVRDSQCGYTALSREAAAALDLRGLWPSYGYPNDLLGQLAARGMVIAQVKARPVYADEVSRLKLRHLPAIGGLIARAWVRRKIAGR